ncbi:hypothetical protein Tco_1136862, partial [Tanacetum coccineum]
DFIECDPYSIEEFVGMLEKLGLGNDRILFNHFRISGNKCLCKAGVSLVEQHAMEVRSGHTNSVVIEEMVEYDWVNEVGKEENLLLERQDLNDLGKDRK